MKASVIVTTYNDPVRLLRALEGLSLQERFPDEVVVADDGSGPETAEAVSGFSGTAPFPLLHVRHEDMGFRAGKIRNEAIKKSSGDYIILLDGDCIPERHFVGDHLRLAERGCFLQGKRVIVCRKASETFSAHDANSFFTLFRQALGFSISNSHHILRIPLFPAGKNKRLKGIKSCNMGFWRDDLFAVNGFNEAFVGWGREDSELAVRLFRYGLMRKEHPFSAICFHLWHPASPKDSLPVNDALLEKTLKVGGHFCKEGMVKAETR